MTGHLGSLEGRINHRSDGKEPKPSLAQGLVTDVSGPQRNACPGTLRRQAPRIASRGVSRSISEMRDHKEIPR